MGKRITDEKTIQEKITDKKITEIRNTDKEITVKKITTNEYLTKSNLPESDYVINPYTGCPHGCKYCYACFMKRFTGHTEPWGTFIDIKKCNKPININKLSGKNVFLSSVTDCYNRFEERYCVTRKILEQLKEAECEVTISTKSDLILRDIDILKQFKSLKTAISINTLDEKFRMDMDCASTIKERLDALKILHSQGIHTVLFMSPIFPYITDFKKIIDTSESYVREYWFENLNLRGIYKQTILNYISEKYPELEETYKKIFCKNDREYWINLSMEIKEYCRKRDISYVDYFYHRELVETKRKKKKMNKFFCI